MLFRERIAGKQIYLDANVFIYALEKKSTSLQIDQSLAQLFGAIANAETFAKTSAVTKAEVLIFPIKHKQEDLEMRYRRMLSGSQGVSITSISDAVLEQAVKLRATTNMKLADAIHAATAILSQCDYLITGDKDFQRVGDLIPILLLDDHLDT